MIPIAHESLLVASSSSPPRLWPRLPAASLLIFSLLRARRYSGLTIERRQHRRFVNRGSTRWPASPLWDSREVGDCPDHARRSDWGDPLLGDGRLDWWRGHELSGRGGVRAPLRRRRERGRQSKVADEQRRIRPPTLEDCTEATKKRGRVSQPGSEHSAADGQNDVQMFSS